MGLDIQNISFPPTIPLCTGNSFNGLIVSVFDGDKSAETLPVVPLNELHGFTKEDDGGVGGLVALEEKNLLN